MSELKGNITTLPLEHPIRLQVNLSLGVFERLDSIPDYNINRSALDYVRDFHGLQHLFSYARRLKSKVFDIGAGTTRAIWELSNSYMGTGLEFSASSLSPLPQVDKFLGRASTHITSVEYMDGVENESIGVALAMASVAYSTAPEYAMRRVNEILTPGGAFKATFNHRENRPLMRSHEAFTEELKALGYDIAIDDWFDWDVVLAVKPGGDGTFAEELLERDRITTESQRLLLSGI